MRWLAAAILTGLASVAFLALALGGATTSADAPAADDTAGVVIKDGQFLPSTLTVPAGSSVTWTNLDRGAHHVISDDGSFDSGPLATDQTFSWQFDTQGSFSYHSHRPGMSGSIVVRAAGNPRPADGEPPAAPSEGGGGPPAAKSDPATATLGTEESVAVQKPEAGDSQVLASASAVTIDAGNLWFCDASFENGVCDRTISVGDTVTWNFIEGFHDATECGTDFANAPGCTGAQWVSPTQSSPFTWSHTFDTAGTYYYLCTVHPTQMRGRVIVQGAAGATPTPSPSPQPGATPTPTSTPGAASGGSTSDGSASAGSTSGGLPAGGGPPPESGGHMVSLLLLGASALAFVASAFAFGGGIERGRSDSSTQCSDKR